VQSYEKKTKLPNVFGFFFEKLAKFKKKL